MTAVLLLFAAQAAAPSPEVLADLKARAVPLTDLPTFRASVGNATVVGLGEATHGSREIFETKARLFRDLVEHKGFTILALESNMALCQDLDRYVLNGAGDPKKALAAQGFWTWDTQEHLDLVLWMRAWNADPKHRNKLRVVGVDVQNAGYAEVAMMDIESAAGLPKDPRRNELREGLSEASEGFGAPEEAELAALTARDAPRVGAKLGAETARFYARLAVGHLVDSGIYRRNLTFPKAAQKAFAGGRKILKTVPPIARELAKTPASLGRGAKWALDLVANLDTGPGIESALTLDRARLMSAATDLRAVAGADGKPDPRYGEVADLAEYISVWSEWVVNLSARDEAMAANIAWIGETYLPDAKAAFWGHNTHVSDYAEGPMRTTGHFLRRRLKAGYFALGFAFGTGAFQANDPKAGRKEYAVGPPPPNTVDGALATLGRDAFLPLKGLAPATVSWTRTKPGMKLIGANYDPAKPEAAYTPAPHLLLYDGLIFLRKTTRVRPLSKGPR